MRHLAPLTVLLPALSLSSGCCIAGISGVATGVTGTAARISGASGASTAGAASGSSNSGNSSSSSGGTGTRSSTGTSGGRSGGASTGTMTAKIPRPVPIAPLFLLDAGPDTVFGPVSIAVVPGPGGEGLAKLGYSRGDGGQFGIMLQTLSADAGAIGEALEIATTGVRLEAPIGRRGSDLLPAVAPKCQCCRRRESDGGVLGGLRRRNHESSSPVVSDHV